MGIFWTSLFDKNSVEGSLYLAFDLISVSLNGIFIFITSATKLLSKIKLDTDNADQNAGGLIGLLDNGNKGLSRKHFDEDDKKYLNMAIESYTKAAHLVRYCKNTIVNRQIEVFKEGDLVKQMDILLNSAKLNQSKEVNKSEKPAATKSSKSKAKSKEFKELTDDLKYDVNESFLENLDKFINTSLLEIEFFKLYGSAPDNEGSYIFYEMADKLYIAFE
ncbi:MAG: hypothetical protein MHPSP_002412, partial [Paramarteilia canceri]